ncbi:MAG: putative Ig domain-containing protein, partial [Acidimicrobiales bacterium]
GPTGSVSLTWQAICHAANYIIYRSAAPYTSWTEIGTYATPDSATLPDNSSGDTSPAQGNTVCDSEGPDPTTCGGEQELTFTDTGATSGTASGGITYMNVPMPTGWTPPIVENANELPWEQNPNFTPALQAVRITTVGADASKAYPDPADDQFGIGATYSGATYAAGQPFVEDGTGTYSYQVAPRHPINIFYNVATNAQELDEYNTLYSEAAPDSQCHSTTVTTCSTTLLTFADVINQVVTGMLQNMLSNNPEVSYVHQTNLMGTPPYSSILPPANYVPAATAAASTDGDGTLYEVLNPLISEYDSYFNSTTPYVQLTLGGIGNTLADQTNWSAELAQATPTVSASETNGVVTIANTGTGAVNVPVTVPPGTTVSGTTSLQSYAGVLSNWLNMAGTSSQTLTEGVAPAITSSTSANAIASTPFSFTVTTTGEPAPALTESGALPSGLTFTDNGNGTATIAGTPAATSGAIYPITITATSTAGTSSQQFSLTVADAPSITSPSTATFSTGVDSTYDITTTGYPAPTLTETAGTLPTGLVFTDNGNGTGTISGTPATGTQGTYPVTLSATNSSGSTASLVVTITVDTGVAPALSIPVADFSVNQMGSVVITATGSPTPAITETGAPPAGLTFTVNSNGTATITGEPTATGTTPLTITASNGISPAATGTLNVVVGQAPAITSANSTAASVGEPFSFTVTTSGYPVPAMSQSGLPVDLSFADNGNGTATISGTPSASDVGTNTVTLTATNGTGTTTQTFTLTVGETPTISSPDTATATVGTTFSFMVTDAGSPVPSFSESGALPTGVTFVDNKDGTASFEGTPATGTGGVYPITITATNGAGSATQAFTLTVDEAASITSGNTATFAATSNGNFPISAGGYPVPVLTETGALPSGVSFTPGTAGKATLAGTPAAGTQGTYPITITATGTSTATQSFTLVVNSGLAITSASSATATAGTPFTFSITTTGTPAPTLTRTGTLPSGLTFTAGTNGTATLAGTPATTDSGTYALTFTAKNSTGTDSQAFTLTIDQAPSFTSATSVTETAGTAFSFLVSAKGYPAPIITAGSLPSGVSFTGGTGSATLSGSTSVAAGTYSLAFTATGATPVTQSFALTVKAAGTAVPVPTFTSAASATATAGKAFTFPVTTTVSGSTTYTINVTHSGTLPAGVSFSNNGNGTATISGTPTAASGGVYTITLKATDSAGSTTQTFVLTVEAAPTITSAASATATVGSAFSFTVKATGAPVPAMTESASSPTTALPSGLTWTDNGNGTATLSGIAGTGAGGVYKLTLSASNTYGTATQAFTLTVDQAPAITSASSATATHGTAFTFTFTTSGYPLPTVTHTGTVRGLTYTRNTNGTATLSGTPTTAGTYTLTITAKNSVGTATQTFTLAVK